MKFAVMPAPAVYVGPPSPIAIYALVDPRDWTIRYVGQTDDTRARLRQHLSDKRAPEAKREWIAELKAAGLRPLLVVLTRAEAWNADQVEREHIERFSAGGDLYNVGAGRPLLGDAALAGRVQVKVTKDEEAMIRALAKKHGTTASVEGRKLFQAWLAQHEEKADD